MTQLIAELSVVEAFFYIVVGWVLIAIWERFFENFIYRSLPLKRNLPYHNFIVAFVASAIFLVLVTSAGDIVRNDVAGIFDNGPTFTPIEPPVGDLTQTNYENPSAENLIALKEKDVEPGENTITTQRSPDVDSERRRRKSRKADSRSKRRKSVRASDESSSERRSKSRRGRQSLYDPSEFLGESQSERPKSKRHWYDHSESLSRFGSASGYEE